MKQTIKIKRSTVAGREPSNLTAGELAVNLADEKLYTADTSGNLVHLNQQNVTFEILLGGDEVEIGGKTYYGTVNQTLADNIVSAISMGKNVLILDGDGSIAYHTGTLLGIHFFSDFKSREWIIVSDSTYTEGYNILYSNIEKSSGNRTWVCSYGKAVLGKKLTTDTSVAYTNIANLPDKYYYTPNAATPTYYNVVSTPAANKLNTYYEDDYENLMYSSESSESGKSNIQFNYEYVRVLCIEGVTDTFTPTKGDTFIIKIDVRNSRNYTKFIFGNEAGTKVFGEPMWLYYGGSVYTTNNNWVNYNTPGYYYTYVYDGTYMRWVNWSAESDSTNVPAAYFGLQRTAKNIIGQYKLVAYQGSSYVVGLSTAQPASITTVVDREMTTESFDVFNHVFYKYSSGNITDGALSGGAGLNYFNIGVDLRWTFNLYGYAPSGVNYVRLLPNLPLYLVCVPQNDGQVKLDTTAPITQTLPSNEDGKVYKYLGECNSNVYNISGGLSNNGYALNLSPHQPVYYYKGGQIREWTNAESSSESVSVLLVIEDGSSNYISYKDTNYMSYGDLLNLCEIISNSETALWAVEFRDRTMLMYASVGEIQSATVIQFDDAEGNTFYVTSDSPTNPEPEDPLEVTVVNLIPSNGELSDMIGDIDTVLDEILGN